MTEKHLFNLWAYCFMPDHFHILVEGRKETSNFKKFISAFKQRTSFEYKKVTPKSLWQENYYERVLRKTEDTINVVKYILNNPIRKGLVKDYLDYPYSGSFVLNIKDL